MVRRLGSTSVKDKSFFQIVTIEPGSLRITTRTTAQDPKSPDRTASFEIERVSINDQLQFVARTRGEHSYAFWQVSKDVVLFDNGTPNQWVALRHAD